ncbi:MAG: hypothetical protein DI537_48030 [Stutzerimonas stutzeri]|nr:MAG: hypothetical protein DI537_48030 [Stutzerimonas stutzeri]
MILMERGTPKPYRYTKDKLVARVWHKYVIHRFRHGDRTQRRISDAKAWSLDNLTPGGWMVHIVDATDCALFYIEDDQDAMLFELAQMLHPQDKRGKKDWSKG